MAACLFWATANAQHSLVIIGSSTSSGVGASTYDSSYAGRYANYLSTLSGKWSMTNLAVGGFTTYHLMPTGFKPPTGRPVPDAGHNITKALSLHPDVILLALGANDFGNHFAASEYESNYDSLKSVAEKAGTRIWITTTVPRSQLDSAGRMEILAFRKRTLERYAPRVIDFFEGLGAPDGKYLAQYNSGDGVHTNNRGHQLLFNKVVAANLTSQPTTVLAASSEDGRVSIQRRAAVIGWNGGAVFTDGRSPFGFDPRGRALSRKGPGIPGTGGSER
jgi:lysophospholipase L1-like esterase